MIEEYRLKQFGYTKGTEYFLANHTHEMAPFVFNIVNKGDTYDFIPANKEDSFCAGFFNQKSLLGGLTFLMAAATAKTIEVTKDSRRFKNQDKRFILKSEHKSNVVAYIDFTHNMVFPDNDEYYPVRNYICPNHRKPLLSVSKYTELLPKDLIIINYNDNLNVYGVKESKMTTTDFFKEYIKVLAEKIEVTPESDYATELAKEKQETLLKELSTLKVKDQIDIPTKIEFYGVCNKFGDTKRQEQKGIVAILYIEHKVSLDDYVKFKELCDSKLNEYLKPLNLDVDYIKNLTQEQVENKYDTFEKIDKLMQACGQLQDPRGFAHDPKNPISVDLTYISDDESRYNNESGLATWKGIKQYYPELYKGLRLILDQYNKLKVGYNKRIQDEYNELMINYANQHRENLINQEDGDILNNGNLIIKYINKIISDMEPIKADNIEEFNLCLSSIYDYILDDINEIYMKDFLQQIKDYKLTHLKSNKMEIIFNNLFGGNLNVINDILALKPFYYNNLQSNIQEVLNTDNLYNIKYLLNKISVNLNTIYNFYLNGNCISPRQYHDRTIDGKSKKTVEINDINAALHGKFLFAYQQHNAMNIFSGIDFKHLNINKEDIQVTKEDLIEVINAFLVSPFMIKIITNYNWQNDKWKKPTLKEPTKEYWHRSAEWIYDSDTTNAQDIIDRNNITAPENIKQYISFNTVIEFTEPDKIVNKLKETNCYKQAINKFV